MTHGKPDSPERRAVLRAAADAYFSGLEKADFSSIPFAENVVLRAPLTPGGARKPLVGKNEVKQIWWEPIKGAIGRVEILARYYSDDGTGICTAALVTIAGTDVTLRVADRFTIDGDGFIIEQENHFDPRDVTNPGWATAAT